MTEQVETQKSDGEQELSAALMAVWGNPEMSAEPQRLHERLREQGDTVRVGPLVMLNTRAAVEQAVSRPDAFSSQMASSRLGNKRPLIPMQIDPPGHRHYRKLLDPLFSPRQMGWLEPHLISLVSELIDSAVERGACDYADEFATPFVCRALLMLLGLPEGDLDELVRMKNGVVHPPRQDPAESERVQRAAGADLYRYFENALAERANRSNVGLLSHLLTADMNGRRLTRDEIVDICYLLVLAGLDPVADTLTLCTVFLARNPAHRKQLVSAPDLTAAAVEELLRWESPVPGVSRLVTQPTEIAGCPLDVGDLIFVGYGAANTDPGPLPDATTVRFDRESNHHLAFGTGIHRCLGAQLARLEMGVALREWHRRIPDYAIADGTELQYAPGLRSVVHLPIVFTPAAPR